MVPGRATRYGYRLWLHVEATSSQLSHIGPALAPRPLRQPAAISKIRYNAPCVLAGGNPERNCRRGDCGPTTNTPPLPMKSVGNDSPNSLWPHVPESCSRTPRRSARRPANPSGDIIHVAGQPAPASFCSRAVAYGFGLSTLQSRFKPSCVRRRNSARGIVWLRFAVEGKSACKGCKSSSP